MDSTANFCKKLEIPEDKRVFFVGDLHGHFDLYKKGCKDLGITPQDYVISVGDNIDRGSQNYACVAEFAYGRNRYAVRGNHCQMLIDSFTSREWRQNWIYNGGNNV